MIPGSVFRQQHIAFSLKIPSLLEMRFSEPKWYKYDSKSALVRPLFICGLPDFHTSAEMNKDWCSGYITALEKTSNHKRAIKRLDLLGICRCKLFRRKLILL
jgi:hypothetical protein